MDKNIRDKLLASFSIGIGFWLINVSHANNYPVWNTITALISGIAFIFLLVYSIKAVRQREKILGWTYLIMDIVMILSYISLFVLSFLQGFFS